MRAWGAVLPTAIPSPSESVWYLGPLPLRAYALFILAGIVLAFWLTSKRWVARGGIADDVLEICFWAVPFGIVGGRLYHVITTPEPYWGEGGNPVRALYIWEGGLGIWGAIALGALGAYIGCRRQHVRFSAFADAVAPGLLVAQAVGRLGNWFNQELFGSPTTLPWGLRVDDTVAAAQGYPPGTLFHPTFLYELLWNLVGAALLIYLGRRFVLGHGRVFWLYVLYYTIGRLWIELLRIDTAEIILGLRLNVWTSILVGIGALCAFIVIGRRHPGREDSVYLDSRKSAVDDTKESTESAVSSISELTVTHSESGALETGESTAAEEPKESTDTEEGRATQVE